MVDPGHGGLGVKVFYIWGALCATCALFAYWFVPETKGLTLEQVDRMMEEVDARRSWKWRSRESWARELAEVPVSGVLMDRKSSVRESQSSAGM